ncbi:MAG TPA: exodeoxyribonuclease VII large subunit [bacterium]
MAQIPFTVDLDSAPAEVEGPKKAQPREKDEADTAGPKVLTVTQLTRQIRSLLEGALPNVAVEGEISNLKAAASGHLYFNLKDSGAQIRCVMFRGSAQTLKFRPDDGLAVIVMGRLSVYEARGEYQIQALALEPQGTGALQLAFEQLKRKLEEEGLFDPERKRPLPFLPRRIGIVTSPKGAAIRDMLTVLGRRCPTIPVLIYPAVVQGDAAKGEIATGIEVLNELAEAQQIDVIIVGRGGGSVEDLWAFNEEVVARAIAASAVPIVSAVGHEVDFTIADFVADVRAPTPSAAAEIVVPNRIDLAGTVQDLKDQLIRRTQDTLALAGERREHLRARLGTPEAVLQQVSQRVDDLIERIAQAREYVFSSARQRFEAAVQQLGALRPDRQIPLHKEAVRQLSQGLGPALGRHIAQLRERLQAQMALLDSLSPLTVLGRGYALVTSAEGKPLRSVRQVQLGDTVGVRLPDGRLEADVRTVTPGAPPSTRND